MNLEPFISTAILALLSLFCFNRALADDRRLKRLRAELLKTPIESKQSNLSVGAPHRIDSPSQCPHR